MLEAGKNVTVHKSYEFYQAHQFKYEVRLESMYMYTQHIHCTLISYHRSENLKYFRQCAGATKIKHMKIKYYVYVLHCGAASDKIFLMRKFKMRIILTVKFPNLRYLMCTIHCY